MKKLFSAMNVAVCLLFFNSCYYDKANLLYPNMAVACDTSAILYSTKVVPILSTQCYNCHRGASAGGGIVLGTYANDKVIAVNGKLYGSITHAAGFSAMPKGGSRMNSCQTATIRKWIDAGSPNN